MTLYVSASREEGMATHCSLLAWRIPWTEEPGGLQSTGSHRVGHDRATEQQAAETEKVTANWGSGFPPVVGNPPATT